MQQTINLYHYLPKKKSPLLSSNMVFLAYGGFLALLTILYVGFNIHYFSLKKQLIRLETAYSQVKMETDQTYTLPLQKETTTLSTHISTINTEIQTKQQTLTDVNEPIVSNVAIFADQIQALADVNLPQVQLNSITLANDGKKIIFTGLTNNSLALIYFIKKLHTYPAFQNIPFSTFNAEDKPDDNTPLLSFTITSNEES